MRALRVMDWGGLSQVRSTDVSRPVPASGEYLLWMVYSGVNFMDVYTAHGAYKDSRTYPLRLPLTLGVEGCGTVEAAGSGAESFSIGERVSLLPALGRARGVGVRSGVEAGARSRCGRIGRGRGRHLSGDHGALPSTRPCHAVPGRLGARVVGVRRHCSVAHQHAPSAGRAGRCNCVQRREGRHLAPEWAEIVLATEEDIAGRVREITGGGAAIVYDSSAQATISASTQCLRRRGTLVLVGTNSGSVKTLDVPALMEAGSISFIRPRLADYTATQTEFGARTSAVFGMAADGKLDAAPSSEFPLGQGVVPMRQLVESTAIGKSVLSIGPE